MAMHVSIPSSARCLPAGTLISSPRPAKFASFLVHQCPPIVALRAIYCGKRSKRKRPLSLPPQLKRLVGQAFSAILSNPRILPSPLNLIAEEFVGGGNDGGNSGSWGGSRSGWRWSDGWGRRGLKRGLGFWLAVILIGLSLVIVKEIEINQQLGVLMGLGLGLGLGLGMMGNIEKLIKDYWVLRFCCLGVLLLGLCLNKELRSSAGKFVSGASKWRGGGRRNRGRFLGFRK